MKFKIQFKWYDLWVGAFWDAKRRTLYVCPLPTLVLRFRFRQEHLLPCPFCHRRLPEAVLDDNGDRTAMLEWDGGCKGHGIGKIYYQ